MLAAGHSSVAGAQAALEKLCRTYWFPLYAFARRQGNSPEDAQDLTQDFFCRLLQKNYLAKADPDRGKFRTLHQIGPARLTFLPGEHMTIPPMLSVPMIFVFGGARDAIDVQLGR